MTVSEWLRQSENSLRAANIATARLDCLVLLEDAIGKDRTWLLAYPEHILQIELIKKLNTKIVQRCSHVPLAYIRGKSEFYGREFVVNEHTLVPRPETETMIELLKSLTLGSGTKILDVGTGSGCIAISAALELPQARVSACDIDTNCLETAQHNAEQLQAQVTFFESNLLVAVQPIDIVLANLPYVPDDFHINTEATHEPTHAIFGGPDGLDLYRTMFEQLANFNWKPRYVLCESLPTQHSTLADIAKVAGFRLQETDDFIQLFRYVH